MRLRKTVPDELLFGAGVYDLDPNLPILACQAAALLGRSKTRMDSDRRDNKPPPFYKEGAKVLYPLGGVLAARHGQAGAPEQPKGRLPTFQAFATGKATGTWPMLRVDGFPVELFTSLTLRLHPNRVDPEGVEDMTLGQIQEARAAFYREHAAGWGQPAWMPERGRVMRLTSKAEILAQGYEQTLDILFDPGGDATLGALGQHPHAAAEKKRLDNERRKRRDALLDNPDYRAVRVALDQLPDDFYMSRTLVQFYLDMSPGSFKKALAVEQVPHPFGHAQAGRGNRAGATKGEVDAWYAALLAHRHKRPTPNKARIVRDLAAGRPHLVDDTGTILTDAALSTLGPEDVAYALSLGANVATLTPGEALEQPWSDPQERKTWARAGQEVLQRQAEALLSAAAHFHQQGLLGAIPAATTTPPRRQMPKDGGRF